jgi:hypothetical protein
MRSLGVKANPNVIPCLEFIKIYLSLFDRKKMNVSPAQAGTQGLWSSDERHWIPACAGMTLKALTGITMNTV